MSTKTSDSWLQICEAFCWLLRGHTYGTISLTVQGGPCQSIPLYALRSALKISQDEAREKGQTEFQGITRA
jgi:hypothetical protein